MDEVKELVNRYCSRFRIEPEDYMHERIIGTAEEIASMLGLSVYTVLAMQHAHDLPPIVSQRQLQ
jgi:hypothetical protein